MIFETLTQLWINQNIQMKKAKTLLTYSNICANHIIPTLGNLTISDETSLIVKNYILNLYKENYSHNTISSIVSVLKQINKFAIKENIINFSFTNKIELLQKQAKETSVFTQSEQEQLISYCLNSNKLNHIGIVLSLYSGVRIGELLALTWDDINFENNLLSINKTASYIKLSTKAQVVINSPKTKASYRVIPIPKQIITYLKRMKRKSSSNYIISTKSGEIVKTRSYQKTYERILKKLKIKYRSFHTLRHTFATNALEIGMDIKALSEILGHKSPTTTLNRYAHSLIEYKTTMMNKLGKSLLRNK